MVVSVRGDGRFGCLFMYEVYVSRFGSFIGYLCIYVK